MSIHILRIAALTGITALAAAACSDDEDDAPPVEVQTFAACLDQARAAGREERIQPPPSTRANGPTPS